MNLARRFGAALLLSGSFGTGLVAIRVGVGYFRPITFALLRLVVVAVAFLILLAVTGRKVRRERRFVLMVAVVGILNVGLPNVLAASALRLISSTQVSIMLNLIPVFSVVLGHFFLSDERLSRQVVAGVAVAVLGAALVVWGGSGPGQVATTPKALRLGTLLVIANALSIATSNILLRRWLKGEDTVMVTGGQMLCGLAAVLPLALIVEGLPDLHGVAWQGWTALLWAALIGGFLGYSMSFYMIRHFGVTIAAISSTGTPLVTAIAGALLLHERITPLMAVGALGLIAGVVVVNRWSPRGAPEAVLA